MKIAIVYYSYSGNTRKVAEMFKDELKGANEVDLLEIKAFDESSNFFKQCLRARNEVRAKIEEMRFDLSGYDLIFFGTPVWAFKPAPALMTYFDRCSGLNHKRVNLFITCGSGLGTSKCVEMMQDIVKEKGAHETRQMTIPAAKIKDKNYVSDALKNSL